MVPSFEKSVLNDLDVEKVVKEYIKESMRIVKLGRNANNAKQKVGV